MRGRAKVSLSLAFMLLCGLCADASPGHSPSLNGDCVNEKVNAKVAVPEDGTSLLQTRANVQSMSQRTQESFSKSALNVSLPLSPAEIECLYPAPGNDCTAIAVGADILGQSVSSLDKCKELYREEKPLIGHESTYYRCRKGSDLTHCSKRGQSGIVSQKCIDQSQRKLAYIFVDIDGVLNHLDELLVQGSYQDDFLIQNLKSILTANYPFNPAIHIVLSSTWRLDGYGKAVEERSKAENMNQDSGSTREAVKAAFEQHGFSFDLNDVTPDLEDEAQVRLDEILAWLRDHAAADAAWLAIDDMDLKGQYMKQHVDHPDNHKSLADLKNHVVKTDPLDGLIPEVARDAVRMLTEQLQQ